MIFVAVIPALLAAPFAILLCEIYMILLHPDGSVPQNGFVASYENLREVSIKQSFLDQSSAGMPRICFDRLLVITGH